MSFLHHPRNIQRHERIVGFLRALDRDAFAIIRKVPAVGAENGFLGSAQSVGCTKQVHQYGIGGIERYQPQFLARRQAEAGGDILINIIDAEAPADVSGIKLGVESAESGYGDLEMSYAEKLDNIALKTNRIFGAIITDLFSDDELLPRLRRLFWLEATKAERDFNNLLVKPMLKQHDRNLADPELRKEMEIDLESVSDVEELMRVWEGLHTIEASLPV